MPKKAPVTGDQAYHDHRYADRLKEIGWHVIPVRQNTSKRRLDPAVHSLMSTARTAVETTGSLLERLRPKPIHSVPAAGFELKVGLFVLACSLNFVF